MNFDYKKIRYTIARYTGMVAISASVLLFACGESNHYAGGADSNDGSESAGGTVPGSYDTLTVGGASDGTPPGYGAMQDTVATPGVNMDSIRQSQTGSSTIHSGNSSGEVNTSANPSGTNSALADSVNVGTRSRSSDQMQSDTDKKNIQPNNKNNEREAGDGNKSNIE